MDKKEKLFKRQKLLLALLQAFGGHLSSVDLQKYLFLFTKLCQKDKSYEFVPYRFGCFSFQSYADKRRLTDVGAIAISNYYWELADDADYISQIPEEDRYKLLLFKDKYKDIRGDDLIKEIYRKYPYYAIKSEIASNLMSDEEIRAINANKPVNEDYAFFTIGYEGQSFENYLNRLIRNNIKILCDVRKNSLSRKYGFSKSTLSETLKKLNIHYVHIPELGIDSEKRQQLKTQADYEKLFNNYEKSTLQKNKALDTLEALVKEYKRVAITCFEADHCMCHRGRIAKVIKQRSEWKYEIIHI